MIRQIRRRIIVPGLPHYRYQTNDGEIFDFLEEAVEHDAKINPQVTKTVVPEQVWTVQQAINMAIAENRVVRFESNKSNKELKKEIVDLKGCKFMKPSKDSNQIAVIPPSINNYTF